jgi:cbb3-type cytochrome oxidase subunit 1
MEHVSELSTSEIRDLKMARAEWEPLPIIITLFTPILVAYATFPGPMFGIVFVLGRIEFAIEASQIFTRWFFNEFWTLLLWSVPALIVSIVASGMLHRLANGKTSSERVLRVMIVVTIVWAIYSSIFFFGSLSVGRIVIGPVPVPFGPLVAILIRGRIMKMTKEIDELQKSPVPMD